jgi:hypothetical protein
MATIFDTQYNPGFTSDWEGLAYESAEACTPRWYGVSSGNGNDGVSHLWPDYYCRTSDPWTLAKAALVSHFNPKWMAQASKECELDGEAEYTISAVLYEPLDREPEQSAYHCDACDHEWTDDAGQDCCEACGSEEITQDEAEYNSWCDANGAYMIVEVFPIGGMPEDWNDRSERPQYDSIEDCFGHPDDTDFYAMVRED